MGLAKLTLGRDANSSNLGVTLSVSGAKLPTPRVQICYIGFCVVFSGCAARGHSPVQTPPGTLPPFLEPATAVSPPDASGTFHFAFFGRSGEAPIVNSIVVTRAGYRVGAPNSAALFVCSWRAHGSAVRTQWKYGSTSDGSITRGSCAPLEPGKAYEITVGGSGLGSLGFEVLANGSGSAVPVVYR